MIEKNNVIKPASSTRFDCERSFFLQITIAQRISTALLEKYITNNKIPIRIGQLFVLLGIYDLGICTQTEIADYVFRDKASIQRTIVDFSRNNFVQCSIDRNDKRKMQVSLTEIGKSIANEILAFTKEIETYYADCMYSV